jgi:hypothetical protein
MPDVGPDTVAPLIDALGGLQLAPAPTPEQIEERLGGLELVARYSDAEEERRRQGAAALGRGVMLGLAEDLGRALERMNAATKRAQEHPLTDEGEAAVEEALWRLDACREKLQVILFLALGLPTIRPYRVPGQALNTGVTFRPDWPKLNQVLDSIATSHAPAKELSELLTELYEHPAIALRNEISHGRAPIRQAGGVTWLELVGVTGRRAVTRDSHYMWPQGMSDRTGIDVQTLWDYVVEKLAEATALLSKAVGLAAQVLQSAARLEQPQPVFQDHDTGEIITDAHRLGDRKHKATTQMTE